MKKKSGPRLSIKLILASFTIALFVLFGGFSFRTIKIKTQPSYITKLEQELFRLRTIASLDQQRQQQLKKIITIITEHNPNMSMRNKESIATEIIRVCSKYSNLNADLICATITHESANTWDPTITSSAGAMGLMQIMPATGMDLSSAEKIPWTTATDILYHPIYNIQLGSRYLNELIESYGLEGGLAAYNGGVRIAAIWLANKKATNILYEETQKYIPAVLKLYQGYQKN